jgi:hypothetical protein
MRPLRYSINVTLDGCCDHREMVPDEAAFERGFRRRFRYGVTGRRARGNGSEDGGSRIEGGNTGRCEAEVYASSIVAS